MHSYFSPVNGKGRMRCGGTHVRHVRIPTALPSPGKPFDPSECTIAYDDAKEMRAGLALAYSLRPPYRLRRQAPLKHLSHPEQTVSCTASRSYRRSCTHARRGWELWVKPSGANAARVLSALKGTVFSTHAPTTPTLGHRSYRGKPDEPAASA